MTSPTPAVGGPSPAEIQSAQDAAETARGGTHPAVLAVGSALLFWLAFPPVDRGFLAWFALVPLLLLVSSPRAPRTVYASAWLGGLVFWTLSVEWVRRTDPSAWLAWVTLAGFLSLWWPAFILLARAGVRRLRLPLMVVAPVIWIALEYLRAHLMTGLPWYYAGHTQYRFLAAIQVADFAGAWGVSLIVLLVNAWLAGLLADPLIRPTPDGPRPTRVQVRRLLVVAAALLSTLGYGAFRLATAHFADGPRVALIQTNFAQALKIHPEPEEMLLAIRDLIIESLEDEPPDLVVWPETSYPRGYPRIDPRIDPTVFDRQVKSLHPDGTIAFWRDKQRLARLELNGWSDRLKVPMLVGTTTYDFRPEGLLRYNSALLFAPGGAEPQAYHKLHLVPFGEYVPLLQSMPWLRRLTPYSDGYIPSLTPGEGPAWFDLAGRRYATAICFEDTVPHVTRALMRMPGGHDPDVLLNISNDGWFGGSSELDVHLAICTFRAVENRVPVARAVNTGISALIDGNGRIVRRLPKSRAAVLEAVVPLDPRRGLYTAWGDWLALGCAAVTIGLAVLAWTPLRRMLRKVPN